MSTPFSALRVSCSFSKRFLNHFLKLSFVLFILVISPQSALSQGTIEITVKEGDAPVVNVSPTEVFRNRKLLNKTIKDLESFRLMMKYMGDHKDDNNRLLLMEETDRYVDKYAVPLIENRTIYHPATFELAATLVFFKAFVYLEGGNHDEYLKTLDLAKEKFGKKHLEVKIDAFNDEYKTIGEAINSLKKLAL